MTGLVVVREQLMDLKETLLETCVAELKEIIIGSPHYTFSTINALFEGSSQALQRSWS